MVSAGGGSKMGLMKPKRTTTSQTINSRTGPMKGIIRSQVGTRGLEALAAGCVGGAQGAPAPCACVTGVESAICYPL